MQHRRKKFNILISECCTRSIAFSKAHFYMIYLNSIRPSLTRWRHQMETFSALLAVCAGMFDVSLLCAWTNGWVNNLNADNLKRHCAHYDVFVMGMLVNHSIVNLSTLCQEMALRRTGNATIWTKDDSIHWHTYAPSGVKCISDVT